MFIVYTWRFQYVKEFYHELCASRVARSLSLDVEPVYTFRGHLGPVLCLAITGDGDKCFSAGLDGDIRIWNVPSINVDPYDSYGESQLTQWPPRLLRSVTFSSTSTLIRVVTILLQFTYRSWAGFSYINEDLEGATQVKQIFFVRAQPSDLYRTLKAVCRL